MVPDRDVDADLQSFLRGGPQRVVNVGLAALASVAGHRVLEAAQVVVVGVADERRDEGQSLPGDAKRPGDRVEDHQRMTDGHRANRSRQHDEQDEGDDEAGDATRDRDRVSREDGAASGVVNLGAPARHHVAPYCQPCRGQHDEQHESDHDKTPLGNGSNANAGAESIRSRGGTGARAHSRASRPRRRVVAPAPIASRAAGCPRG